jgi:DNA-directed RNA polymerase subunit RPC12/RpoP
MEQFKEVEVLKGKKLSCPYCENEMFMEYDNMLIGTGPMKMALILYEDGKGYLCSKCGRKQEFFPHAVKFRKKGDRKAPTTLKIKGME